MLRGLILVVALAGPAMAQQPSQEIKLCSSKLFDYVDKLASDDDFFKDLDNRVARFLERCMLESGFTFRDIQHCMVNMNSVPTSLVDPLCYEPIR